MLKNFFLLLIYIYFCFILTSKKISHNEEHFIISYGSLNICQL